MQFVCRRWSKNQPLVCATSPCALWKWLSNDSHPISCLSSATKLSRSPKFCTKFSLRILLCIWERFLFAFFFLNTRVCNLFFILWVILFPDSRESRREICRWGGFTFPGVAPDPLQLELLLRKFDLEYSNGQTWGSCVTGIEKSGTGHWARFTYIWKIHLFQSINIWHLHMYTYT